MGGLGLSELIIILVIALLVFGAGKLPQVGSSLGKAIRDFRRATSGMDEVEEPPASQPAQAAAPTESLPSAPPQPVERATPAAEETPRS